MATFKAVTRGVRKDGFMHVYIRVTHRGQKGYIKTDKMITKKELSNVGEIKDLNVFKFCTDLIFKYNELLNKHDISKWTIADVIDLLQRDDGYCINNYENLVFR